MNLPSRQHQRINSPLASSASETIADPNTAVAVPWTARLSVFAEPFLPWPSISNTWTEAIDYSRAKLLLRLLWLYLAIPTLTILTSQIWLGHTPTWLATVSLGIPFPHLLLVSPLFVKVTLRDFCGSFPRDTNLFPNSVIE